MRFLDVEAFWKLTPILQRCDKAPSRHSTVSIRISSESVESSESIFDCWLLYFAMHIRLEWWYYCIINLSRRHAHRACSNYSTM